MIHLREARRNDHWETALKRDYPLLIKKIEFIEGQIFGNINLPLNKGLNAIIGKNGVGKSNFIRAIYNSLSNEASNRRKFSNLLDSSKVNIDLTIKGTDSSLTLTPFESNMVDLELSCFLFDPCSLIPEIQNLFNEQENLNELLESFQPVTLSPDDLLLVNFLTNSRYSSVKVINIEDEYDAFPMLPYFIVERDGVEYDSRKMGLGELSLLYFFWLNKYIMSYENSCLFIIEEPESFIPPSIQSRLCDVLAMLLATKGVTCLISTHSEHILKKIPRNQIHIMNKIDGRIIFSNASLSFSKLSILGLKSPSKGLLFFEDNAAMIFTKALIKYSTNFVIDSFYYHISGSDSKVLHDLEHYPNNLKGFSFIAVFDGDCKVTEINKKIIKHKNYVFLPTNDAPEPIIIDYLRSLSTEEISKIINDSTENVSMALDSVQGLDHHDYFIDMANILSVDFNQLFNKLCESWIQTHIESSDVKSFISRLESLVK